jgi:hypothetical protein
MTITHRELDLGMSLFLELIQGEDTRRSSFASARADYFPTGGAFAGDPLEAPAAEMRFLEWFLFEHELDGKLVVESLLPAWREIASPALCELESVFLSTMASMFVLGDPAGDGLYWLRDIAGLGEYAADLRTPPGTLQAGDLVVGRLYSSGDSTHALSPGAGCFRDADLFKAVTADIELARTAGQRKALRMRQVDLEAMFWGRSNLEESATPPEKLRAFLSDGGLSADEIDGLIESLTSQPLPEDTSSPLVAGYLGELLNHLAFETDIDLTRAQDLFLSCWVHLQSPTRSTSETRSDELPPVDGPASETKTAVDAFSNDRSSGLDAESAIARLCERLGIEVDDEGEEEPDSDSLGFAVLPALLTEYLWDIRRTEGEEASLLHKCLERPLSTVDDIQIVEELTAKRLLLLGCTHLAQDPDVSLDQAALIASSLDRFCRWCVEHHGVPSDEAVDKAFASFPASLVRVLTVNQKLKASEASGDWFKVEAGSKGLVVRDSSPDEAEVSISSLAEYGLEEGDFVRGALQQDELIVTRCYPRELNAAR